MKYFIAALSVVLGFIACISSAEAQTTRIMLPGPAVIYVDGISGNDGSTAALYVGTWQQTPPTGIIPFLTLQNAINFACNSLDLQNQQLIIEYNNPPSVEPVIPNQPFAGSSHVLCDVLGAIAGGYPTRALVIRGNLSTLNTPAQTVMNGGDLTLFTSVNVRTGWLIEGFYLESTSMYWNSDASSQAYLGANVYGGNPAYGFAAIYGSLIEFVAPIIIDCAEMTVGWNQTFWYADGSGSRLISIAATGLIENPPSGQTQCPFHVFASSTDLAYILSSTPAGAWTGIGITGYKFAVNNMGGINTSGAGIDSLPGNLAGIGAPPAGSSWPANGSGYGWYQP